MSVAISDAFSAEEYGTGRLTPLAESPAWLKAESRRPDEDRATLTPYDRAFLESPPTYEEGGSVSEPAEALPALAPAPSPQRRVMSLVLFVTIAGGASAVLALAALRFLAQH